MSTGHTVVCVPAIALGLVRSSSYTPNPYIQGPQTPGFCSVCGVLSGARSVILTVTVAAALLAIYTADVPTEAGRGQVVGLRSVGQEVTEPGLAPVWLALKATLFKGPRLFSAAGVGVGWG